MAEAKTITIDRAGALRLLDAYNVAKDAKQESFMFDGNEYVTTYAYYVILHLINSGLIDPKKKPERCSQ